MDLSIITVTYQSRGFIPYLIGSVMASGVLIDYEHWIVDNASADGTAELVREQYGHVVQLIANRRNEGFAAANHAAVQRAKGRYLLFLNPDMELMPFSMDRAVAWMDAHPDVGIAGCRLLDVNGSPNPALQPRRFPGKGYFLGTFLGLFKLFPALESSFFYSDFKSDCEQEVDHVRGAFMLVRREVVEKLGRAFDLGYYLLVEDMDFCREVKALGYRVMYTPSLACTDYFHQSFQQRSEFWKFFKLKKSLLRYLWKWEPYWFSFGMTLLFPISILIHIHLLFNRLAFKWRLIRG